MKHILEPDELEAIRDLVQLLTRNYWDSNEEARINLTDAELYEAVELANRINQWLR